MTAVKSVCGSAPDDAPCCSDTYTSQHDRSQAGSCANSSPIMGLNLEINILQGANKHKAGGSVGGGKNCSRESSKAYVSLRSKYAHERLEKWFEISSLTYTRVWQASCRSRSRAHIKRSATNYYYFFFFNFLPSRKTHRS